LEKPLKQVEDKIYKLIIKYGITVLKYLFSLKKTLKHFNKIIKRLKIIIPSTNKASQTRSVWGPKIFDFVGFIKILFRGVVLHRLAVK